MESRGAAFEWGETSMKPKVFSAVLLVLLAALPVRGAKICNTEMDTLLRVHASRDFHPFPPHEPPYRLEEEYVVTHGGTAAVFRTSSRLFAPGDPNDEDQARQPPPPHPDPALQARRSRGDLP